MNMVKVYSKFPVTDIVTSQTHCRQTAMSVTTALNDSVSLNVCCYLLV